MSVIEKIYNLEKLVECATDYLHYLKLHLPDPNVIVLIKEDDGTYKLEQQHIELAVNYS